MNKISVKIDIYCNGMDSQKRQKVYVVHELIYKKYLSALQELCLVGVANNSDKRRFDN